MNMAPADTLVCDTAQVAVWQSDYGAQNETYIED